MATYEFFLTDTMISPLNTKAEIRDNVFPNLGYLSPKVENYFLKPATMFDTRPSRLSLLGDISTDKLALHFDSQFTDVTAFVRDMTDVERTKFLNIVEKVTYQPLDAALENLLKTESIYAGYVAGSLTVSTLKNDITVDVTSTIQDVAVKLPNFFGFKYTTETQIHEIKIFINGAVFLTDYNKSTITKVILPCEGAYLLAPASNKTIIDTITNTSTFVFHDTDTGIKSDDTTGVFTYKTRYLIKANSFVNMPFGIMYKGKLPSTLSIRTAIRAKLTALNIAEEDTWKGLLPDLFVTAQFYLVPMYKNYTVRPERTIYKSIINQDSLLSTMQKVFPDMDASFMKTNLEVLMNGVKENFTLAIPDPLNEATFSIAALHPTYVYHNTQDPAHVYMDAATREFNIRFNQCTYIVFGEVTGTSSYMRTTYDGKTWVSFVAGAVEYLMLTEESYNAVTTSAV